jgi:diguanylate cyclase (GGDEF)-like protein
MSMRDLLAGYAVTLALFVVGCLVIERNAPGLKGVRWLKIAFGVACAGLVLAISRSWAPPFFSIILPHLAVFSALVFIHQAINDVLDLNRRYLHFSLAVGLAALIGLVTFTVIYPNVGMRIYTVDTADALQAGLTTLVLFQCRNAGLRSQIRTAGYLIGGIAVIHLLRIMQTIVHPPHIDLVKLDTFQAFFIFFIFILGLSAGLSLIWLSFCSQRNKLQALAHTDGLTGLLNRRAFEETLHRELIYAQRCGQDTGLVLIDLDFFKSINDTHGHAVGDEVIRRASAALQIGTRGSDALARFGGEEFIAMLRDMDLLQASMIAERIRQQVESLRGLPVGLHITASIGVAVSSSTDTLESLLKKADDALYDSKRSGRNTVTCHRDVTQDIVPEIQPQSELLTTRSY